MLRQRNGLRVVSTQIKNRQNESITKLLTNWQRAYDINCYTGPDDVPAELFKAGGETALYRMHRICVAIKESGEWPEEWTFSTFIPLYNKGDLDSVKTTEQLLWFQMQVRFFFQSY